MAGRKPGCAKTGGRKKGATNKRTIAKLLKIDEYCAKKGYDPLHAMVDIATDETMDLDIKFACHKEVAKYLHSQRKAVELAGKDGEAIKITVELSKLND